METYLLLETGGYFLLEDGGRLILEFSESGGGNVIEYAEPVSRLHFTPEESSIEYTMPPDGWRP